MKRISNALKLLGFRITLNTNLKIVNFLDVTLNLKKSTFEPYKKRMIHPFIYTLLQTTHSQLSNKYPHYLIILPTLTFSTKTNTYDNTLKNSSYKQTVEYTSPKSKPKHRNRNIIWFNPPYNQCIASNIGNDFLNLICKHFPNHSFLAKIFNWNNIKVIYSCTSNISQIIKGHQKKIEILHSNTHLTNNATVGIKKHVPYKTISTKNVVYRATVKTNNSVKQYIGAMESTIKQRIYNHNLSFPSRNYSTNAFFINSCLASKGLKYLTYHHLANTKTSPCL